MNVKFLQIVFISSFYNFARRPLENRHYYEFVVNTFCRGGENNDFLKKIA